VTGLDRIEVSVIRRGDELTLYRVCGGDASVASFVSSFARVTVWGRPLQLLAAVIEETPIEF
jgi:hypothetical protein